MPSSEQDGGFYGIGAWREWLAHRPYDLRYTRRPPFPTWPTDEEAFEVGSYRELVRAVSFLSVMNKRHTLAFRGQARDSEPLPTMLRNQWRAPTGQLLNLSANRAHYRSGLVIACDVVTRVLRGNLPRHRPFETYKDQGHPERRVAPWAVIQHYELWPTPLLDLTTSLRVAASFALGFSADSSEGCLYVFALDDVINDVMEQLTPDARFAAIRLSAVCPPMTERPHLQEGILVGDPRFGLPDQDELEASPLPRRLVMKFRLVNGVDGQRSFWDADFPPHTSESLLPKDDIGAALVEAMNLQLVDGLLLVTSQ